MSGTTHLHTEPEAAALLHISPRTLRALRSEGKIRYVRLTPRRIGYTPQQIADYIAESSQQDAPPCPSTNPRKAVSGNTISNGRGSGIMDRLAARPGGMPKGLKLISGGKSR